MKTSILAALFASTLIAAPALAQSNSATPAAGNDGAAQTMTPGNSGATGNSAGMNAGADQNGATGQAVPQTAGRVAATTPFLRDVRPGSFRFTDLKGKNVYDTNGNSIGTVDDVVMGPNGQVRGFLIGVGGFLGIGQKDVAVETAALTFGNDNGQGGANANGGAASADMASTGGTTQGSSAGDNSMTTASTATGGSGAASGGNAASGSGNVPQHITLNVTKDQLQNAQSWDDITKSGANGNGNGAAGQGSNAGGSAGQGSTNAQ
ncbi:PRC-barrel domain-containing protein [Jiella sp. M17.18]|uniref:PRC-barrel domain-containing protein n=1 Tax=Jiella sp. M17.18 TaxID=3234247 RepID=UPI0034DEA944